MDSLKQIKEKLATIETAIQTVVTQEQDFLEQVGAVRKEIEATVQQLMQLLQESERQLMRELDQVTDAYIEKISARKKEADITIAQLKSCKDFAEEELRIGSQQEILAMKGQMLERMAAVCSLDNLRPLEDTRVRFVKSASVLEACHSLGSVVRYGQFKTASDKTCLDISSAAPLSCEMIYSQLSPIADPTVSFPCVVHQVAPGSFEVRYSPSTAGHHHLRVQVGGTNLFDTPLNVEVMPRKAGQTFTGLTSILRGQGKVTSLWQNVAITVSQSSTLLMGGRSGALDSMVKDRDNSTVQGVAVTQDGRIVVVDCYNHRLQVLTAEGAFISTVGSEGYRPLQFNNPIGVAVHHNGQIFVTEYDNHRVQVINVDLTYSHCFGSKGAQPGQFNHPEDIAIDADGMVYVADYDNNRVQKFTPEGKLLAVINSKGEGGGRLNGPHGLCVDTNNGILYVTA